jgi:hypothetical protein
LEEKEVRFWNNSGLNPLECVPLWWVAKKIRITGEIPLWDNFNRVWLDISEKRPNMMIKPSYRMAKENEYYMEKVEDEGQNNTFKLLFKDKEGVKEIANYSDGKWSKTN